MVMLDAVIDLIKNVTKQFVWMVETVWYNLVYLSTQTRKCLGNEFEKEVEKDT